MFIRFISLLIFVAFSSIVEAEIIVDGRSFATMKDIIGQVKENSRIYLTKGVYKEGLYTAQNGIQIIGEPGVVFDGATVDGKAALVLAGDNVVVESISCINIKVPHGNGSCIRLEGRNQRIRNIHVADSESGIMTAYKGGKLTIEFSKFERLGGRSGYTHALYINVDELVFRYSSITETKGQGSGLKSRSKKVTVEHSLIASMEGTDSRAIDAANYGELIVKNSILQQGKNSSNSQLIAYGLEQNISKNKGKHSVTIENNLILLDREKANVILAQRLADKVDVYNNVIIGDFLDTEKYTERNDWYLTRSDAKIKPSPYIPELGDLSYVVTAIRAIGNSR